AMKSTAALKDHPLHPMLVSFPLGLFFTSLACDIIGTASGSQKLKDAGYRMMLGGLVGGLAAAVPGIVDYLTVVPPESEAAETGRNHGLANLGVMGIFGVNALLRARGGNQALSVAMSAAGCGVMTYAGWLGGKLVYEDQIGVVHLNADGAENVKLSTVEGIEGDFVTVCSRGDLKKGQIALVVLNGERIALAQVEDDRYAAFSDRCTHMGGPLSDGALIGGSIMCPWHGSQFNTCSGAVECGPADQAIRTLETRVQGDSVQIKAPEMKHRSIIEAGSLA
ncbi:MAG: Rieske 2Fe-2S domain-containing protein, partial [Chloroflexi bacterium]|nr:Rieske 2Fe-2S domain-containing protein [Chloroflexota bacterium]